MPELWERQDGETAKAFDAFCAYRDLGPGRSLDKVSRTLHKSVTFLGRWSSANDWTKRAAAYDDRIESVVRAEVETEKIATAVEFVRAAKTRLFAELNDPGGDWRAALEALKRLCRDEWGDSVNVTKYTDEELIARAKASFGGNGTAGADA